MSVQLPSSVAAFAGRINDVDTHEMMPAQVWVEHFGAIAKPIAEKVMARPNVKNPNDLNVQGYEGDVRELTPETLWSTKGPTAPGAVDLGRRLDVMDMMGASRQLMFPTAIGLTGALLYGCHEEAPHYQLFKEKTYSYATQLLAANNEWAVEAAKRSSRIRPVTPVYGETPEELVAVSKSLIDRGIRALCLVSGRLPGGRSPAHNDLDPFYAMLAEAKVPLTLHIGGELKFFGTTVWGQAKAFEGFKLTEEVSMDPWRISTMHLAPQNFLTAMVTGGVFDRHPNLRVGVLEYGAQWIGPLAELLDMWHDNNNAVNPQQYGDGTWGRKLPMRPSEYIRRNIRVAPFDFEPIGKYIEKYGLKEVFCFASDYPHVEGGRAPVERYAQSMEHLGKDVMERFFVTNGEWLLPE